jgi:hypothetical protein
MSATLPAVVLAAVVLCSYTNILLAGDGFHNAAVHLPLVLILANPADRMCHHGVSAAGWEEDMYHSLLQTCSAFQPDVIVADMTTLAAHDAAETLKLPLALLGSMPLSLALDLTGTAANRQQPSTTAPACNLLLPASDRVPLGSSRQQPLARYAPDASI